MSALAPLSRPKPKAPSSKPKPKPKLSPPPSGFADDGHSPQALAKVKVDVIEDIHRRVQALPTALAPEYVAGQLDDPNVSSLIGESTDAIMISVPSAYEDFADLAATRALAIMEDNAFRMAFDRSNEDTAWHAVLPRSADGDFKRFRGKRVTKAQRKRGKKDEPPGFERTKKSKRDLPDPSEHGRRIYARIEENLASVAIPRNSGEFKYPRGNDRPWGINFTSGRNTGYVAEDGSMPNQEYVDWMETVDLEMLGLDPDARATQSTQGLKESEMWTPFQAIRGEGDPAAVQTKDGEILTLMSGLSAKAKNVGKAFMKMPALFHDELYRFGMRVDPASHTFETIDPETGHVETGDDALILIANNHEMLAAIVGLMQSDEVTTDLSEGMHDENGTMVHDAGTGKQLELRAIAYRALFERFKEVNRDYPASMNSWSKSWRTFAVKLRWKYTSNWADWSDTKTTKGMKHAKDPKDLAHIVYANGYPGNAICTSADRYLSDSDMKKYFLDVGTHEKDPTKAFCREVGKNEFEKVE